MAGQTLAPEFQNLVAGAITPIGGLVPVGKFDSVCLSAALNGASLADAYIDVLVLDAAAALLGAVVFNEPVRYRQPGGSPILLLNFIVGGNTQLAVRAVAPFQITATLFNRYRFDG